MSSRELKCVGGPMAGSVVLVPACADYAVVRKHRPSAAALFRSPNYGGVVESDTVVYDEAVYVVDCIRGDVDIEYLRPARMSADAALRSVLCA